MTTRTTLSILAVSCLALSAAACSREEAPVEAVDDVPVAEQPEAPPAPEVSYACESGRSLSVRYVDSASAEVTYEGQTYTLNIARSASGARYAGPDLEWWTAARGDQETATLSRLGPNEDVGSTVLERCSRPANTVLPPRAPGEAEGLEAADPDMAPPCRGPALRLAREGGDAGAGNRQVVMSLTNAGSTACSVRGYPGLVLRDADGDDLDQVRTVQQSGNYFRAGQTPEVVELEPNGKAYFDLSYSAVPHENLGETRCPSVAEVIARAPGDTADIPLDLEIQPCGRQVRVSPLRPVRDGSRPD
jgi:membrane-bound inhibitor of C-type lysozyme